MTELEQKNKILELTLRLQEMETKRLEKELKDMERFEAQMRKINELQEQQKKLWDALLLFGEAMKINAAAIDGLERRKLLGVF